MALDGKTVGLALSGGGYRAALFGLGTLWRLNDAGLLGKLDGITSVSGGSILAGVLAHRWQQLQFAAGRASNFAEVVATPLQAFCCQTIDVSAGIAGILTPFKSAGDFLIARYKKDLFGETTLKDVATPADGAPLFTFYATNLQTGRSFRLRQDKVSDWKIGELHQSQGTACHGRCGLQCFPAAVLADHPAHRPGGVGRRLAGRRPVAQAHRAGRWHLRQHGPGTTDRRRQEQC